MLDAIKLEAALISHITVIKHNGELKVCTWCIVHNLSFNMPVDTGSTLLSISH